MAGVFNIQAPRLFGSLPGLFRGPAQAFPIPPTGSFNQGSKATVTFRSRLHLLQDAQGTKRIQTMLASFKCLACCGEQHSLSLSYTAGGWGDA